MLWECNECGAASTEQAGAPLARTVLIACAEPSACDSSWKAWLHDHAVVVRNPGGDVAAGVRGALAELLRAHTIERVIVLGHRGCAASGAAAPEPLQNTATLAAWYRLMPAVGGLARERAAGTIDEEGFRTRLAALVQLANLEGCAELHTARRRGEVEAHAAVYDAESGAFELFDGTRFAPIGRAELARLVAGMREGGSGWQGGDGQSGFHPLPDGHDRSRAEWTLQSRC